LIRYFFIAALGCLFVAAGIWVREWWARRR
jgi:hypothetical protein